MGNHLGLSVKLAGYLILSVFCLAMAAFSPASHASDLEIRKIAQSPFFRDAQVSPDGRYFLARVADDPFRVFSIFSLEDDGFEPLLQLRDQKNENTKEEFYVDWSQWANEDTVILRVSRLGGGTVSATVGGERETYARQFATSLYVFNVLENKSDAQQVWQLSERGTLISILPKDPDHVLVQHNGTGRPSVYKYNIRKETKPKRVQKSIPLITSWIADREGNVRGGWGRSRSGKLVLKLRPIEDDSFTDYSHLVTDIDQGFTPLSFTENPNILYVASNHETNTLALYRFNIATGTFLEQIHHNPDYDISSIMTHGDTGALQGIQFSGGNVNTVWFDRDLKAELEALKNSFPGNNVRMSSVTENAEFAMVTVSAPNFPGQMYIYDRKHRRLIALPEQYAGLTKDDLGKQVRIDYKSRDGATIQGFITLPVGATKLSDLKETPFIIMPHGGPAARDFAGFDPWVQFYAMRGYGVLQMNFRGSTGYGLEFELAGRQQWGQLMQDDITDGVQWLTKNGYADADKIAIVGASYGGYAALMGAIKTPELYQCAISFAGVTDLFDLVNGARKDSYITRLVGDRFRQSDELRRTSPLHRAEDIAIPVQLLHGRLDPVVPFEHSEYLHRKMKSAKKDVEFVILPQSGHNTNDYEDRLTFYRAQADYIEGCL